MRSILLAAALAPLSACMQVMSGPVVEDRITFVTVNGADYRIRETPFGDGVNSNFYVTAPNRNAAIAAYHAACWSSGTLDLRAWDGDRVPYFPATGEHLFIGNCPDRPA